MRRRINLRQIEAFEAVMEKGTVSRAAELLNISQPAMSKLISNLELDTGLTLFDRANRRLMPTEHALRLHAQVERIFTGVRHVERAVDALRREDEGRLLIGVAFSLAGAFIRRATNSFLEDYPNVFCSVQSEASPWILQRVADRKLDIGVVNGQIDNPNVRLEPLITHPLVCIMAPDNPLAGKSCIDPSDLDRKPFVAFEPALFVSSLNESFEKSHISSLVNESFENSQIRPKVILSAATALSVCEFVATGPGVSLVHPLMVSGMEGRLIVKPYVPYIPYSFQLCYSPDSKNARLVNMFAKELRATAARVLKEIVEHPSVAAS